MRTIRISDEVWQAIAAMGKFGETEDDVLRRKFELPLNSSATVTAIGNSQSTPTAVFSRRRNIAGQRMSSYVARNQIHIQFQDGATFSEDLPKRGDKVGIRAVLDKALAFAREHDASLGQLNAVRKTFTNEGIWLTK